jgi:hypothetical protein
MKKHFDFKNNKVLLVLFSLLFLTTAVHTLALIRVGQHGNQAAQVVGSDIPSSCLTVSNPYNSIFSNPFDPSQLLDYSFSVNVDITNNCPRPVNIIDPATLNTNNSKTATLNTVSYMGIDYLGPTSQPVAIPLPVNSYGVPAYGESMTCMNCPQGAMQYRLSPVGTGVYQGAPALRAFSLPVGQTKRFAMDIEVGVGHSSQFNWWLRAKPLRFKWFYNNAFADNSVTATEISTFGFTSTQQNSFATDYTNISQDGADGSGCTNGTTLGFNDMFEPVCE